MACHKSFIISVKIGIQPPHLLDSESKLALYLIEGSEWLKKVVASNAAGEWQVLCCKGRHATGDIFGGEPILP